MEILRMFIDLLKNLSDLLLVFFALQNFLPCRPLRHLIEFEHVINKYPGTISKPKCSRDSIERTLKNALSFLLIMPRPRSSTPYSQLRGVPQF